MNQQSNTSAKPIWRGELALFLATVINTFGVVLMLYSGSGISAISSVPYSLSLVLPQLSLGTWTYLFQGLLILSLMIMKKRFVLPYLFSFVVGFVFGKLLDVHELWISILPDSLSWRVLYFIASYLMIGFGISLSNRCGLPVVPTDLFPRELAQMTHIPFSRIKISFDVICLSITAGLTWIFLGHIDGLGIGTVLAALTTGKVVAIFGEHLDRHFRFVSFMTPKS